MHHVLGHLHFFPLQIRLYYFFQAKRRAYIEYIKYVVSNYRWTFNLEAICATVVFFTTCLVKKYTEQCMVAVSSATPTYVNV